MRQKLGKNLCSLLITLTMIFGLFPGMSLTAQAAETTVTWSGFQPFEIYLHDGQSTTKDGVTLKAIEGMAVVDPDDGFMLMGTNDGDSFEFSVAEGKITKIVIACSYGSSTGTGWSGFTWTGSASSVDCSISALGVTSIVFTIEPATVPTYDVSITSGSNMTKTTDSGAASQADLSGAMTAVVYTADDGYYFPTDYSVEAVNGISVTRDSYTQITVSGTPTADAAITLTAPTAKTTPDAPTTAAAVNCTTTDNNDGKLTGVTTAMEYKKSDADSWTDGTGSDITGLVPGTYYVRVKATDTANASDNQELTIAAYVAPKYTVTVSETANGTVSVSKETACEGDQVTITITPDNCFELDSIKLNDEAFSGSSFNMPAKNVTISVTFKAKQHQLTPVSGKAATCEADGFEAYYKCSVCEKLFSDSEGKHQIAKPAAINKLGHELSLVNAKMPTKNAAGNIAYYKCGRNGCGKLFKDANGTQPLTSDQTVLQATGHDLTKVSANPATCTEDGNTDYYECKDTDCNCGKIYSDAYSQNEISKNDTVIPDPGHSVVKVAAKDPSCTENGNIEHWKCSACKHLFKASDCNEEITVASTVIPALGHDMIHHEFKAETFDDDGSEEYYECKRCNKLFADEEGKQEVTKAQTVRPKKGSPKLNDDIEVGNLKYEVTNPATDGTGTLKLIGVVERVETVAVPATETIKGSKYKVTKIGAKSFYGDKTIKILAVSENVAVIEDKAFYGCSNLVKVSGGEKVKTIGKYAFGRCTKLKTFVITSKVLYKISPYAFYKDAKLKTVYIRNTTKLTKSGVKKSLKGSKVKTVKVKKSKVKKYKKYFKKSNSGRSVKVKK